MMTTGKIHYDNEEVIEMGKNLIENYSIKVNGKIVEKEDLLEKLIFEENPVKKKNFHVYPKEKNLKIDEIKKISKNLDVDFIENIKDDIFITKIGEIKYMVRYYHPDFKK